MSGGLDRINRAVRILVGRNAMLNERLYEAAREFSAGVQDAEHWPTKLREKAIRIDRKLTAKGRISATINGMDVPDAEEIAGEILEVSAQIGAAHFDKATADSRA
ncbi:MAG: hypothetical protein V3R99_06805 [Thermoguttaceae bacterium]